MRRGTALHATAAEHAVTRTVTRDRDLSALALIVFVAAIVFLPSALQLTYFRDDWYYMLDGTSAGAGVFPAMFSSDRPARGAVFAWLFTAFGADPLPYQLVSFALRVGSALAAYWLFRQLWPRSRSAPLWATLVFLVYPGYLWWVAGIEYLPMMLSLCLEVLSIALTLAAIRASSTRRRILYGTASVLTGWAYLALVEYAIGIELFRYLCIYIVQGPRAAHVTLRARAAASFRAFLPWLIIPFGFLVWRLLIFENVRAETDAAAQIAVLVGEPLLTLLRWAVNLVQSASNLVLFAWGVPLSENFYDLRLADIGAGFAAAIVVVGSVAAHRLWRVRRSRRNGVPERAEGGPGDSPWLEALVIGTIAVLGSALPIVAANRVIAFQAYSHYALPGSLAAAVVVVAGLQLVRPRAVSLVLLAGLLAIATLTHHAIAVKALTEQEETARFWWQIAWRAPGLEPGTTFLVKYPSFDYGEDASIVWGPANLLYDAAPTTRVPVPYKYSALAFHNYVLDDIAAGENIGPVTYRTSTIPVDFGRLLVASQTLPGACVRVIDSRAPLLSGDDPPQIAMAAPYSQADMIRVDGPGPAVPEWLFGPEPGHKWCYFFEKAELALQAGDFDQVVLLAEQAAERGLKPLLAIEWIPFARAYAILGMVPELESVATRLTGDRTTRQLACAILSESRIPGYELPAEMNPIVFNIFCD